MVFIQNFFSFIQINLRRLLCFPGKSCNKVQIIVQHSILMTVLSLLLHAVQHLLSFLLGFLIHAGILNFLLKTTHIRNILRMQFIQLLLKKLNLFLNSRFPIKLLIRILLGSLRLLTDTENLHQFIDCFLHQTHTFFPGIHLDHMIFFFPGKAHITGQGTDCFRIALPMVNHAAYPHAPLKALGKIHQFLLDLVKFLFLLFRRNILDIRKINSFSLYFSICIFHRSHLYPSLGGNLNAAILIYSLNGSPYSDRENILHGNFFRNHLFFL